MDQYLRWKKWNRQVSKANIKKAYPQSIINRGKIKYLGSKASDIQKAKDDTRVRTKTEYAIWFLLLMIILIWVLWISKN